MLSISPDITIVEKCVAWSDCDHWAWPRYDDHDKGLFAVFDWVLDLDAALSHVKQRKCCVQAGGACGVNPLYLSNYFDTVITLEPDPTNWQAMLANLRGCGNVKPLFGALSNRDGHCVVKREAEQQKNCGAGFVVDAEAGAPYYRIDGLNLDACDFIQLDIEGSELEALQGAAKTIEKFRPVIVIEETNFKRSAGASKYRAREWLINQGYRCVTMAHNDAVMVPC